MPKKKRTTTSTPEPYSALLRSLIQGYVLSADCTLETITVGEVAQVVSVAIAYSSFLARTLQGEVEELNRQSEYLRDKLQVLESLEPSSPLSSSSL